jgi:hypothetical protein
MRKIEPETDSAHAKKATTTVVFRGANRPKLMKTDIDILPDMVRMTGRSPSAAARGGARFVEKRKLGAAFSPDYGVTA